MRSIQYSSFPALVARVLIVNLLFLPIADHGGAQETPGIHGTWDSMVGDPWGVSGNPGGVWEPCPPPQGAQGIHRTSIMHISEFPSGSWVVCIALRSSLAAFFLFPLRWRRHDPQPKSAAFGRGAPMLAFGCGWLLMLSCSVIIMLLMFRSRQLTCPFAATR